MSSTKELRNKFQTLVDDIIHPELVKEFLDELQPYDLYEIILELDFKRQMQLLSILPPPTAAETLEYMFFDQQYHLLDHLDEQVSRAILGAMSSDAVADLAMAVHPRRAEELLKLLPDEHRSKILQLMEYPENTAGGRMTIDYIAVRKHWTAKQVWDHFRKVGRELESVSYLYVVDDAGYLAGVTSLRALLLAEPDTPVSEFMSTKIVSVTAMTDQEEAARLLLQYDFLAIPVVDAKGRMAGIITTDDAFEVLDVEATEDFQRISGVTPVAIDYPRAGVLLLWRKRIGWLLILLLADFLSSSVIAFYEDAIETLVALAFFIPMLIDTGGNTGTQSATLIVRGLSLGQLNIRNWLDVVRKELGVGLLLGFSMGLIVYLRGFFWLGGPEVSVIVGFTMVILVVWSNLIGAVLPMILSKLELDPAVVSSPFITTAVDVTGLIIYFSIAKLFLGI